LDQIAWNCKDTSANNQNISDVPHVQRLSMSEIDQLKNACLAGNTRPMVLLRCILSVYACLLVLFCIHALHIYVYSCFMRTLCITYLLYFDC
jgi:hypothetical protein